MKSLREQSDGFLKSCFPRGDEPAIQRDQMRMAFHAGALVAFRTVSEIADTQSEAEAMKSLTELMKQAIAGCAEGLKNAACQPPGNDPSKN